MEWPVFVDEKGAKKATACIEALGSHRLALKEKMIIIIINVITMIKNHSEVYSRSHTFHSRVYFPNGMTHYFM